MFCSPGGLVKKMLETKKELEGGSQQATPGKKTEIVSLSTSSTKSLVWRIHTNVIKSPSIVTSYMIPSNQVELISTVPLQYHYCNNSCACWMAQHSPHLHLWSQERSHMTDATKRKEREMVQKDINKLRTSIQTLTRSVNPLGKILDFLQEDLDSMQKELETWKKENKQNALALQREQRYS